MTGRYPVVAIPAGELWLWQNPAVIASVQRGIQYTTWKATRLGRLLRIISVLSLRFSPVAVVSLGEGFKLMLLLLRQYQPDAVVPNYRKKFMETDLSSTEHHILLIEEQQDRVILLDSERYLIGRSDANEIVLNRDPISREHAILLRVPVSNEQKFIYRLIDGDAEGKPSTNGIFVNGQRHRSYDLFNDDVISFAGVVNALYIKASLSKPQLSEFMKWIASCPSTFFASESFAATQLVESYLSTTDPTTIMLGRLSADLRDTLTLR